MSGEFNAFIIVATATAINAANEVTQKKPVGKTLIAGVVFGTICVGINEASDSNIGTMLAVVFMLSSFLAHGTKIIEILNTLTTK